MTFVRVSDFYFLLVALLIRVTRWAGQPWVRRRLTRFISWLAWHLSTSKRRAAEQGLETALGSDRNERERESIVRSSFLSFWQETFAILPLERDLMKLDRVRIEGGELLGSALGRGRGVILLESNAFGRRITAKQVLYRRGFRIHQVHVENHLNGLRNDWSRSSWLRDTVLSAAFKRWEKRFVSEIVELPKDHSMLFTRKLQRCLARNEIVCSAGDGSLGHKFIDLPFLGKRRPFATGMFSLARICETPILPLFCFVDENEAVQLILGPETGIGTGDVPGAVASFVRQLEALIQKYPDQYRNWQA